MRTSSAKIKTEANLDGMYLLRCSDPHLSTEGTALAYKQLEAERGWRDMKKTIELPAKLGIPRPKQVLVLQPASR